MREKATLDFYHQMKLNEFKKNRENLKSIREKLKSGKHLKKLREKEKICLEINKKETQYYLTVVDLLYIYYTNETPFKKPSVSLNRLPKTNLVSFLIRESSSNKADLFDEYLYRVNNNTSRLKMNYAKNRKYCSNCNQIKTLDNVRCVYVCKNCGNCQFALIESSKSVYIHDPVIEGNSFSYKRFDHFADWLTKFQNIKKMTVPKKVYQMILSDFEKIRTKDMTKLSKDVLSNILKKNGFTKYNSQMIQILSKLNNEPIPKLPQRIQERMKIMFKQTQRPFEKVCPVTRTNFLSYSYVIRKFLELLKQYKYIEYFPLLKSREKLYSQDLIWKKICSQLNWKYTPSI